MNTAGHVLIVGSAPLAGAGQWYARRIGEADFLIAADGGLELCLDAGRVPDICVGDFDSVTPAAVERARALGSEIVRYPARKNESDLDLAVLLARSRGAGRLSLTAAFTLRLDHTLAALGTLLGAADLHAQALEPDWRGYALDAESNASLELQEPPGTVLSVMAPAGPVRVSIEGVEYPLDRAILPAVSSLGLSNVARDTAQRITLHDGRALVIVNVT